MSEARRQACDSAPPTQPPALEGSRLVATPAAAGRLAPWSCAPSAGVPSSRCSSRPTCSTPPRAGSSAATWRRPRARRPDHRPRAFRARGDRGVAPARTGRRRPELAAEQRLPRRAARRPARSAHLAVSPLAGGLPSAAQHGDRDLADRRADLRAVSRRAPAAGGGRHLRHRQQPRRGRADRPLDGLLQPLRRRAEPARRLRVRHRHRSRQRAARPMGEDAGIALGARSRPSRSSPPATTTSSTSPPPPARHRGRIRRRPVDQSAPQAANDRRASSLAVAAFEGAGARE